MGVLTTERREESSPSWEGLFSFPDFPAMVHGFLVHQPTSAPAEPEHVQLTDTGFRIDKKTAQKRLYSKIQEEQTRLNLTDERLQAWEALVNPTHDKLLTNVEINPYYQVWSSLFEIKNEQLIWRGSPRVITKKTLSSPAEIESFLRLVKGDVAALYQLANTFLDREIKGMNDHSLRHIEAVMAQIDAIFFLICQQNKTELQLTLRDYFLTKLTALFHDCAQALFGRDEHGKWSAMLMMCMVQAEKGLAGVLHEAYFNIARHTTREFEFSVNKGRVVSSSYDISVACDESDIGRHRITPEGFELYFLEGVPDSDIEFNYFTQSAHWQIGEDGVPTFQLKTLLGSEESLTLYMQHLRVRLGADAWDDIEENLAWAGLLLQDSYVRLVQEQLLSHKKLNLWKSSCKTMFGTSAFRIEVLDSNGQLLEHNGVPVRLEPMSRGVLRDQTNAFAKV